MDDCFKFIKEIPFVVPSNHIHETCLAYFAKNHKKEFSDFDENVTDINFSKVTDKLVPRKKYIAKLIEHKEAVLSDKCLKIYEYFKALYVGAQGLSVVYEVAKDELPRDNWYSSFDKKNNLWEDLDGLLRVPKLGHCRNGDFKFGLGAFGVDWNDVLLIICEYPE